ncbi:CyP450 monooxygenase [Schizopora paradoxa]|uniref:CyP450 monooxygenase n=1 Tax=Schizopora paradoxa TaxID=27342 RepID=A0A0H2RAL1_9AGAM|nr:CyP450 monooxygenase [Schizopora paradoxa]
MDVETFTTHAGFSIMLRPIILLDVFVVGACVTWLQQTVSSKRRARLLPPGPPRMALIGNVLDMPKSHLWEKAAEWRKEYGDIIYLENFGSPLVILNSYEATIDLLEKRSIKYSSRSTPPMVDELQDWTWLTVFTPYGNRWKGYRGPIQKAFNTPEVIEYKDIQRRSSRLLLADLLRDPGKHNLYVKSSTVRTIMLAAYGHEVVEANDSYVSLVEEGTIFAGSAAVPGQFLVDIFPWLKYVPTWFPGAGFQKIAQQGRRLSHDMRYIPYENTKNKILSGEAGQSLVSRLLDQCVARGSNSTPEDDALISAVAGMVYAGGTDTTSSVLQTFLLAMTLFPEAQKKGQEEIDRVIGNDRLPDFEDKENLPYIDAIYKECLRWNQPLPLGVPHLLTEDDTYNGYFLPAGTVVAANQWWMMHDPSEFPEPEIFRPERFLPAPGNKLPLDPSKVAFGFGRRVCAGKLMADSSVYITIASILATFDISVPVDEAGNPQPPSAEYNTSSVVNHPMPFDCIVRSRSEKAAALIVQSVDMHI